MFSFLNSAILIAGVAALIPLLIHLFSKRKMKVVQFSSLKYLQSMQKRQVRKIKIRQLLLLALRTLIVALAVMAFARPVTESGYLGSDAGVSAVVLMDISASMSQETPDGPLFDLSRRRALALTENFSEADEVGFVVFGSGADDEATTFASASKTREKIAEVKPGEARGNLEQGVRRALGLFDKATHFNRELFIISDFQANSLPDSATKLALANEVGGELRTYAIDLSPAGRDQSEPLNCGLRDIDFSGQLIEAGAPFTIGYTVHNYDGVNKPDIIASLYIDGQRVAQTDLALTSHESKRLTFSHAVTRAGRHRGRIEISGDDYSGDNQLVFAFHIPETFNMLIVDNAAGGEYVRLALEPTASGVRHWRIKRVSSERVGGLAIDDYDVVALAGLEDLTTAESAALGRFVRRGGGVLYFPGAGLTMDKFNGSAADFLGVRLEKDLQVNPPGSGYYSLDELDYTHPVLQPFAALYEEGPPVFEFYSTPEFSLGIGSRAIARFSGSRPALIEKRLGRGKIITFGGILRTDFTNLMSRSFFVPFVIRLSEYAAADLSRYDYDRRVGDEIVTPLPRRVDPNSPLSLVAPDGSETLTLPRESGGGYEIVLQHITQSGIHTLQSRGIVVDQFAVNIEPAEGDLQCEDIESVSASLGLSVTPTPAITDLAGFLSEQRTGKELWKTLLWLAALLIAVETLFAGDFLRGRSSEDEAA